MMTHSGLAMIDGYDSWRPIPPTHSAYLPGCPAHSTAAATNCRNSCCLLLYIHV